MQTRHDHLHALGCARGQAHSPDFPGGAAFHGQISLFSRLLHRHARLLRDRDCDSMDDRARNTKELYAAIPAAVDTAAWTQQALQKARHRLDRHDGADWMLLKSCLHAHEVSDSPDVRKQYAEQCERSAFDVRSSFEGTALIPK